MVRYPTTGNNLVLAGECGHETVTELMEIAGSCIGRQRSPAVRANQRIEDLTVCRGDSDRLCGSREHIFHSSTCHTPMAISRIVIL